MTIVRRADLALLRGVTRLSRGMLDGVAEAYSATPRERTEDVRQALAGLWLTLTVVLLVAVLAVGTGTAFGRTNVFGLVVSAVVAGPAALAVIHGVLEGVYRRDARGRWRLRGLDGDWLFLVLAGLLTVTMWLVFWVLPGDT